MQGKEEWRKPPWNDVQIFDDFKEIKILVEKKEKNHVLLKEQYTCNGETVYYKYDTRDHSSMTKDYISDFESDKNNQRGTEKKTW